MIAELDFEGGVNAPQPSPPSMTSILPPENDDLIQVTLTPPGEGAITTVLLDGKEAIEHAQKFFKGKRSIQRRDSEQLLLSGLHDPEGQWVDEVVLAPCAAEDSKTGNEQLEVSCHGGVGVSEAVRRALENAGFRKGLPWELEVRAHRRGRLPLPTLEAGIRLARVRTERQTAILLGHDALRERWERLGMEAALGARTKNIAWREKLHQAAIRGMQQCLASLRLLKNHSIAICGPANAGKSTLSNRLLRSDESIVHDQPGTTRDRLVRPATIRGLSVDLIDSAGLRTLALHENALQEKEFHIEREGQARATRAALDADLVLMVLDASRPPDQDTYDVMETLSKGSFLLVLNKVDLGIHAETEAVAFALETSPLNISALEGLGLDELEGQIEQKLLGDSPPEKGAPFTSRHLKQLGALKTGLEAGRQAPELINHIRWITGTRPNETELAEVLRDQPG